MVTLTCSTTDADGVALVTARVEGAAVPRRVRLANRLDGPVWPPRREGIPEAGWDEDGFVGVVPADGALVVGYASPATPVEPPLELVRSEPVAADERATDRVDVRTAGASHEERPSGGEDDRSAAAVRSLGDPRPPRDAVPLPAPAAPDPAVDPSSGPDRASDPTPSPDDAAPADVDDAAPADVDDATRRPSASAAQPETVSEWLDAVEARVETAERLADADDLPAATAAVADAGGLAGAERIADRVEDDATTLAALAERAEDLAARADEVEVPLATLRALA